MSRPLGRIGRVALAVLAGLVAGVVLEAATLFGAPAATPLVAGDWNLRRLLLFACLGTCVALVLQRGVHPRGKDNSPTAGDTLLRQGIPLVAGVAALLLSLGVGSRLAAAVVVPAAVALALVVLRRRIAARFELGYAIVAVSFAVLVCVLMPPSASMCWDGAGHFDVAQAMSYVFDAQYTGADALMAQGGPGVEDTYGAYDHMPIYASTPQQGPVEGAELPIPQVDDAAIARAEEALTRAEESEAITIVPGARRLAGTRWLSFVSLGRIPYAVGLWLGRLLHLGAPHRYLVARLADALFYVACFYLGMRRLRSGKAVMAAVSLVPLFLLVASGFSYDPWCTALVSYAIARFAGECQRPDEPLSWRGVLGILVPFALGCLVKAVMVPLALVFLFMPKSKFGAGVGRRRYVGAVLATTLLVLLSFAAPFVFSVQEGTATGDARGGADVNAGKQVSFVLADVPRYLRILAGFTAEFFLPANLVHMLYYFAYVAPLNTPVGWAVSVAEVVLLLATTLVDKTSWAGGDALATRSTQPAPPPQPAPAAFPRGLRACAACAVVASYALVASALYVSYTPVGYHTINGVQYRYLAPLYVPLLLLAGNGAFGLGHRLHQARHMGTPTGAPGASSLHIQLPLAFLLVEVVLLTATVLDVFVLRVVP